MNEMMNDIYFFSLREMLKDCLCEVQASASKSSLPGISSGFKPLDDLTGGFENGKVYVNGVEFQEDYLQPDVVTESSIFNDFIVPEGYIFAMGDNRTKSTDCRVLGCIPINKIEGIVSFRFWPLSNFGKIK